MAGDGVFMKTLLISILFFLSTAAHATTVQITTGGFGANVPSDTVLHLGFSGNNFTVTNNGGTLAALLSVPLRGQPYHLGAVGTFSDFNSMPTGTERTDHLIYNGIEYPSYTGRFTIVAVIPGADLGVNVAAFTMTGHIDAHTATDILDLDIFGSGTAGTNLTLIDGDVLSAKGLGYTFTAPPAIATPEPTTWVLLASGLGLVLWRRCTI
jgi:hypothetical protein